jgi:CTP:molybdopterin cytidylyltransferase MocA
MNSPEKTFDFSAIILAAGNSSRMKKPKFSLKYSGDISFLENILIKLQEAGCRQSIVVLNSDGEKHLKDNPFTLPTNTIITINKHPEWERFYSLQCGLHASGTKYYSFILNVDNPFVETDILKALYDQKDKADYVFPTFKGKGGHPIMISPRVTKDILAEENMQTNLKDFLSHYPKKEVEVSDSRILANINTTEEYRRLFL